MGTKRIGLARMEALMENLKRELAMGAGSEMILDTISLSEAGTSVFTTQVATVTTAALTVTHTSGHTNATLTQPAGTSIKELILIPQAIITTGSGGTAELDFSFGSTDGGGQFLAAKAILDGAGVSAPVNHPLYVMDAGKSTMNAVNAFADVIATSEASALVATTYSAASRLLYFRFTPIAADLAATGAVKIIAIFQKH